ncbi:FAD/NAD(P)-binding protein [Mesorhizobium sp. M0088]|uniref:FAD/NAD(P)-binding protein n=1 Tax=Mesorhizobium sp. M0088 TaxID=2956873 RepID=UPI0033392BD2
MEAFNRDRDRDFNVESEWKEADHVPAPAGRRTIAIIGAGPAGLGYLERLTRNIAAIAPGFSFDIHVIDPYPAGPGRIWRYDQAAVLELNSQAYDITIFPDGGFTGEGPLPAGDPMKLTFLGWLDSVRSGEIALPGWTDDAILAEIEATSPQSFPTRRLMAIYLDWAYRHVVETAPASVRVITHRARVTRVNGDPASRQDVVLDTGETIGSVDAVIYTVGHCEAELSSDERRLADFAASHGLVYVPPQPASAELVSGIAPGTDVIIRGLGLTAGDAVSLLTEHRGGVHVPTAEGEFVYHPSGREPRIFLGSRKGVPLHTVPSLALKGPETKPTDFTLAAAKRIAESGPSLSFRRDFWPLIVRDLTRRTYAELFAAFPERVTRDWADFAREFDATVLGSEAYETLLREAIPDPSHRFDIERLRHPFGRHFAGSWCAYQATVDDYITDNLRRHRHDSTTTALRMAMRGVQSVIATARTFDTWNGDSLLDEVYQDWYPFFCSIAIGPSPAAQQKLLALRRAGIVTFLGPGTRVELDGGRGVFVGRSALPDVHVKATALIEARIAHPTVDNSSNPALRSLAISGDGAERRYQNETGMRSTGRLRVAQPGNFLVNANGRTNLHRQAIGAFASSDWVSAFALPGSDFPFFRQTDETARATLRSLLGDTALGSSAIIPQFDGSDLSSRPLQASRQVRHQ